METHVGNPNLAYLFVLVAIGIAVSIYASSARRRAMSRFASTDAWKKIVPRKTGGRRWLTNSLIISCLFLLALASLDIRWGRTTMEVPQKGIEVMFVLDVSRSMLAEDTSPNRLDRAKQQIKDLIDEMAGDRIGLIVFAGESRQAVPLTSHYEDFRQSLAEVGPHSVRRGGSRLGNALEAAADGFMSKTNDHKAIVVFTDGEDQESQPVKIAQRLYQEQGIRIFAVGLGDIDRGARIPDQQSRRGGFVEYEGQQVWSKLNGQILGQVATESKGAYIPAGTKRVNMADVYHGYIANVEQTEFETAKVNAYVPRYQWFAVPALLLLILEIMISTRSASQIKSKIRPSQILKQNRAA